LYAILNNTEDRNAGDDFPTLRVAVSGHEAEMATLEPQLDAVRKQLSEMTKKLDAGRAEWEKTAERTKLPKDVAAFLAVDAKKRNGGQQQKLQAYHRALSPEWKTLEARVKEMDSRLRTISTTTPVLREGKPRVTNIQIRGNFLDKGDLVTAGLPGA